VNDTFNLLTSTPKQS